MLRSGARGRPLAFGLRRVSVSSRLSVSHPWLFRLFALCVGPSLDSKPLISGMMTLFRTTMGAGCRNAFLKVVTAQTTLLYRALALDPAGSRETNDFLGTRYKEVRSVTSAIAAGFSPKIKWCNPAPRLAR